MKKDKSGGKGRSHIEIGGGAIIENCGTGILIGQNVSLKVRDEVKIRGCNHAIIHRDSTSLLEKLGLPPETPPNELVAVIEALQKAPNASPEEKVQVLKDSSLWKWVERSANAATVVAGIISLSSSSGLG